MGLVVLWEGKEISEKEGREESLVARLWQEELRTGAGFSRAQMGKRNYGFFVRYFEVAEPFLILAAFRLFTLGQKIIKVINGTIGWLYHLEVFILGC